MEERQISEKESLQLIQQMIHTAKKEQKDDGKGWILWGWLLFLASMLTIVNIHYHWYNTYFFWNLFGYATMVLFAYEMFTTYILKKKSRVRTYTKDLLGKLNSGFFICLMIIIVSMNRGVPPNKGFALLISLYAFWILIYGTALNFKPSIIAAYITWAFGIGALFAGSFELVMVLHASGVLFGYIIPGHIANREFKKLHSKDKVLERV
jgi:hypothetical protein